MRCFVILSAILSTVLLSASDTARAQDQRFSPIHYELADNTTLEVGCQPPCLCPIFLQPVKGKFVLEPRGFDGLFFHYRVRDVEWELPRRDGATTRVKGSGRYQVGGEFAVQHRLELDLVVGEQPPQHFDSGLMVGGFEFPKIKIAVAVNKFFCFDSVFVIRAAPTVPLAVGDQNAKLRLNVQPNPFRNHLEVAFSLPSPAEVDLRIVDVTGRDVSTLLGGAVRSAGRHTVTWNGRANGGRSAPPGVYFVWLATTNDSRFFRLAKIE